VSDRVKRAASSFKAGFQAGAEGRESPDVPFTWESLENLYAQQKPIAITTLRSAGLGFVVTVGRHAPVDALAWVLLALHVPTLWLARRRPRTALVISIAIQLVLYARGNGPNIGVGAVLSNAHGVHKDIAQRAVDEGRVPTPSLTAIGIGLLSVLCLSLVPWLFDWRAAAVIGGHARGHNPGTTFVVLFMLYIAVTSGAEQASIYRMSRQRVTEAEAARDKAVTDERSRIARELHDVVAHQMAIVVAQAQGAEALMTTEPTKAKRALRTISSTTREALVELRRLVGVVRPEDAATLENPEGPQPGIEMSDLAKLFSTAEAAGLEIDAHIELEGTSIPAGVALSVHRTIQEALTNAAKHAPGAAVRVDVRESADALDVEVTNGPRRRELQNVPGSGVGLIGMRERVTLFGGALLTAPTKDGGFKVVARFPLAASP
jgi:signal transduction histidine kinase